MKRLRTSAGLALVTCPGRCRQSYVRGGMAMERVWLRATALDLSVQPMSPAFLYGRTEDELTEVGGPERGRALMDLRERLIELARLEPSAGLVLALRIFRAPPPSAVSLREPSAPARSRAPSPAGPSR